MNKTPKTKATLIQRLKEKYDHESWKQFDFKYKSFIYRIIRGLNVQHHDAKDIGQDVVIKAWKKLPEFDYNTRKGRFRNWLAKITSNTVKDFFRKQKANYNNIVCTATQIASCNFTQTDVEKIEEKEWKEFILEQARKKLARNLSQKSQKFLELLQEGKSVENISKELKMTPNSIYVQKKRVLEKLKKEIADLETELS